MKGLVLSVVIVVAAWLIGAGVGFARAGQKAAAGEPASAPALTEPGAPSQLQAVLAGPRWRQ